jgi:hypothetical protein
MPFLGIRMAELRRTEMVKRKKKAYKKMERWTIGSIIATAAIGIMQIILDVIKIIISLLFPP